MEPDWKWLIIGLALGYVVLPMATSKLQGIGKTKG